MYLAKNSIEFTDILVLRAIMEYSRSHEGQPPSVAQIVTLCNQTIDEEAIGLNRASPISGTGEVFRRLTKLRSVAFVVPHDTFALTQDGEIFLRHVGENWQQWPQVIPIVDHIVRFEFAK